VQQAVVEAQIDPHGDGTEKRLVAYLTMKDDEETKTEPAESSRGPESSIGQLSDEEDSDQEGADEAVSASNLLEHSETLIPSLCSECSWVKVGHQSAFQARLK
jgi:hypothetical protein